jgi:hypothetical protein
MDEILYLEPDEEITSVIDKLQKSSSDSVGLVIPRNSSLIHSAINLKLLKKQADVLKKDIALVTADKIGKNIASQVGIQVFEDVHAKKPANNLGMPPLPKGDEVIEVNMSGEDPAADEASDEVSDEINEAAPKTGKISKTGGFKVRRYTIDSDVASEEPKPTAEASDYQSDSDNAAHISKPKFEGVSLSGLGGKKMNKGLIVFVGIFVVIILATLLLLPQSAIDVIVAAEPFEKAVTIGVDKSVNEPQSADKTVPGKQLEVNNDDAKRVVATGHKDVGGKGKGTITISNGWQSDPYKLPAGTVVTHNESSKTFTLDNDVSVPGVTLSLKEGQLVTTPGTANATVTATEPGDSYNVKSGAFTISGLSANQQAKITASSSKDFSGGFTKTVNIMTQSDIDTAKDALLNDLNNAALEEMKKDAKDLKLVNEAVLNEIVSFETNPSKVDSETDYFDIKVKAKHRALVFDEKQVQTIVDAAIRQEVPEGKELLLGEGDEFVVSVLGKNYDEGTIELESKIKTKIGSHIDAATAKKGLSGKNEAAIREQLSKLPNVKEINLFKFPRWWWQDTSFAPWNTHLKIIYE